MRLSQRHSNQVRWSSLLFLAVLTNLQELTQNLKTTEREFSGTIADTTGSGKTWKPRL